MFPEMETCVQAYFDLIDSCVGETGGEGQNREEYPAWKEKIEEELGQAVAMMYLNFDESSRDAVVAKSPIFRRFV